MRESGTRFEAGHATSRTWVPRHLGACATEATAQASGDVWQQHYLLLTY